MDNDAVPPSSPPRANTTEPPSSPFFEPQRYGAFSPKSSSPPPLFSSDDSGETLDVMNYDSPRIFKNKRKGAWYETENGESTQNTPEAKKAKISRNYDSGICMMSDISDGFVDPLPEHKSPFPVMAAGVEDIEHMSMRGAAFFSELKAGMDRNCQTYDFSSWSLGDDDIQQIGVLNSVIKNLPDPGNDLPVEGQYRSMVPELYVNLARNSLRRLTPSLFNLQHLTSLVLRNNHIEELPSQIGRLQNLQELDVSLNKLQYLPLELLQLLDGKLERLTTIGNPLIERVSQKRLRGLDILVNETSSTKELYSQIQSCYDREALIWHIRSIELTELSSGIGADAPSHRHIARTLVSYFDQGGQLLKGSPIQPIPDLNDYCTVVETNRGVFGMPSDSFFLPPTTTRVSSLLATSVNVALANITVGETKDRLGEPVPFDAAAILAQAAENDADAGFGYFRQCHTCTKDYIVARAEWIEFWSTDSTVIYPFKFRVCSWGCVPPEMRTRQVEELRW